MACDGSGERVPPQTAIFTEYLHTDLCTNVVGTGFLRAQSRTNAPVLPKLAPTTSGVCGFHFADTVCEIGKRASLPVALVPLSPTAFCFRSGGASILWTRSSPGRLVGAPARPADCHACLPTDPRNQSLSKFRR